MLGYQRNDVIDACPCLGNCFCYRFDVVCIDVGDKHCIDFKRDACVADQLDSFELLLYQYLGSLDGYENIFVCGPCWWGTYPMAVRSLLERLDWRGKKVLPLMTHEGSGLGSAERTLRSVCSGAAIARGLAVHGAETAGRESEIAAWAKKNA